jgi:O-antigen/teichoic acid export membrane protein
MNLRRLLMAGSLMTLAMRAVAMGAGLLATLVLANKLGASGLGIYSWALAWTVVFPFIGDFGFSRLLGREIPGLRVEGLHGALRGLVVDGPVVVAVLSIAVAICAAAAGVAFLPADHLAPFLIAVVLTPVIALTTVSQGIAQALGHVGLSRIPEDVVRPLVGLVGIVVCWVLLDAPTTPTVGMAVQAVAFVAAFAVAVALARKLWPRELREGGRQRRPRHWTQQAVPLAMLNGINTALSQVDIILLGILSSPTEVGLYATSTRLASGVGVAEFAVNAAFLPVAATLYRSKQVSRLSVISPKVALLGTAVAVALAAPLLIIPGPILSLFGPQFPDAAFQVRILSLSFLASVVMGQNLTLLSMTGHTRAVLIGTTVAMGSNIAMNGILIPPFGANGAAVAWLCSTVLWDAVLIWQVRRLLGFHAGIFAYRRSREEGVDAAD